MVRTVFCSQSIDSCRSLVFDHSFETICLFGVIIVFLLFSAALTVQNFLRRGWGCSAAPGIGIGVGVGVLLLFSACCWKAMNVLYSDEASALGLGLQCRVRNWDVRSWGTDCRSRSGWIWGWYPINIFSTALKRRGWGCSAAPGIGIGVGVLLVFSACCWKALNFLYIAEALWLGLGLGLQCRARNLDVQSWGTDCRARNGWLWVILSYQS